MLVTQHLHRPAPAMIAHLDELLDEALRETFPASDPIAVAVEPRPKPSISVDVPPLGHVAPLRKVSPRKRLVPRPPG
jgi:hypothetical protein